MASTRKGRIGEAMRRTEFSMPDEQGREGQFDYRLFLRKNSSWLVTGVLALVIVVLLSMVMDSRRQVMAFEQRQLAVARTATATERTPQASLAVNPTAPSASVTAGTPVAGSLTEEEKHPVATGQFPNGSVQGPAIVQWWDGGSQCGIFLLREGETFTYERQGTWWQFSSQEAAAARYPAHRTEYFTSNQGCHEGKPEE